MTRARDLADSADKDIAGTLTLDGLTVDGDAVINDTIPQLQLMESDTTDVNSVLKTTAGQFRIQTINDAANSTTNRFIIDHATGDISFYEDTGSTAKLHWSAADESLGIGTSSPSSKLNVVGSGRFDNSAATPVRLHINNSGSNDYASIYADTTSAYKNLVLNPNGGNVGIGTSSPSSQDTSANNLVIDDIAGNGGLTIKTPTTSIGAIHFSDGTSGADRYRGIISYSHSENSMRFHTDTARAMTIDSSGNLLVGKTSSSLATDGIEAKANGSLFVTRSSATPVSFRRSTTDGDIVNFYKDGTTVGRIGTNTTGEFFVAGDGTDNVGVSFDGNQVMPTNGTGARSDNAKDLGSLTVRWDDIYATNGTIQTSDRNEKQQIAALTDAEITAAKAISQLFKTFKWNSAVTEKGDAARTHTGIIAQEVDTAMTNAGLDAGNYAFFISTTWWEHSGVNYPTLADAPEGSTERNRKGIRYPQLLSFIGAATEQRLASIESRLDALEAE